MNAYQGPERRQGNRDRRSKTRSGKFDRRKNYCETCHFYKAQSKIAGTCQKHQTMIKASDFACTFYVAANSPQATNSSTDQNAETQNEDGNETDQRRI